MITEKLLPIESDPIDNTIDNIDILVLRIKVQAMTNGLVLVTATLVFGLAIRTRQLNSLLLLHSLANFV